MALQHLLVRKRRELALSQADVAELAGVSLNWYQQFESGRGDRQVSVRFIETIGASLRLNSDERLELFRLATPEGQHAEVAAIILLHILPNFIRDVLKARTFRETMAGAAQAMHAALRPDVATVVTVREGDAVEGAVFGQAQDLSSELHRVIWERHSNALFAHVTTADSEQDRGFAGLLNVASWLAISIRQDGATRAILSAFWSATRRFSATEIEIVRGIGSIAEVITQK